MSAKAYDFDDKMYAMDDKVDFPRWLNKQIEDRGLSQAQLARLAGVTRSAINGILTESRGAGPDVLLAIARALKLPPETVFRAAGLLPPRPDTNPELEEANYKLSQLPEWQRKLVLDFIDTLIERSAARPSDLPPEPSKSRP